MRKCTLVLIALVTSLAGCATGELSAPGTFLPPQHEQVLAQAPECCASYSALPFAKLAAGQERRASIASSSPVFAFANGKSFFSAFELPAGQKRIAVVKTYPVNMLLNRYGHVLVPAVLFLDAQRVPLDLVSPKFAPRNPVLVGDSWGESSVPVPEAAQYLVLLDAKPSSGISWRDADQRGGYLYVRPGPTGDLRITVRSE